MELIIQLGNEVPDGRLRRDPRQFITELFDTEGRPKWLEHPVYGRRVDVVALKIGERGDAQLLTQPVNKFDEFTDFLPIVGEDAFVIGFPMGLEGGPGLPIWKRASIATEPLHDLDGLPKLLVDTATRRGMSGSPVVARRRGLIVPTGAKTQADHIIGTADTFLGIYSSRIGDDPLGVQLGVVWKARVIDEIIAGGVAGSLPY